MTEPGFGIYVHWPFCQAKCPYCDFNSHVVAQIDHDAWRRAYTSEIARIRAMTGERRVGSIYFGGGTPSLMEPATVETVLSEIQRHWHISNDCEITLEANPTSVEAGRFRDYRLAGVGRVSMGIQALNDPDLKRLGRLHSVAEAETAFEIARETFDRVSFDLIYARQDQTLDDWATELDRALAMAADHLSLYQLTIEPETAFGERYARGGLRGLPSEDLSADMYELTQERCEAAGMPAYEVSNHARPGSESRHNMIYWTGGDYAGIGPGAHGRLTLDGRRHATETATAPLVWLKGALTGKTPEEIVTLDDATVIEERLLMGLRIAEGVPLELAQQVPDFERKVLDLEGYGLVERTSDRFRVTETGRPVLNGILRALFA
ncbi:radical SAM family heme chaperone HemW [Palleronia sp. LCG004]|uniref:radical SAM family heme chaperone HemW n=1 Tax=Palleronia sp. LCG004 TaxID=3079304 RepID=UPI00294212ED|nr:radical SAM family heme chaperone HemW [Palleronia sp. LCG004]WOI55947.1 radical SAM family heme chaperone HemW [Palleronia sp. LCG004]